MTKSAPLLTAIGTVLLAAIAVTFGLGAREGSQTELDIIATLQDLSFPGNTLSNLLREATTTEADIAVGVVLAVVLWAGGHRGHAISLSVLLIALPILQHELKEALDRDRPPFNADDVWSDPGSRSFPSGHTMSATVVYGWFLYCALALTWPTMWRRFTAAVSMGVLTLVPLASVYLAVHWPSDVLGGYLWGLCLALPGVWFSRHGPWKASRAPSH